MRFSDSQLQTKQDFFSRHSRRLNIHEPRVYRASRPDAVERFANSVRSFPSFARWPDSGAPAFFLFSGGGGEEARRVYLVKKVTEAENNNNKVK